MKDEVTLEQALELLMEDQPVHVFDENGMTTSLVTRAPSMKKNLSRI